MARLKQKIIDQAKLNDRRFGKGIVCRLIHDDTVVNVLNQNGLLPLGVVLSYNEYSGVMVSYSVEKGLYFALPITVLEKYEEELSNYTFDTAANLVSFLRQNLVMIRIPPYKCPNGNPGVDPVKYDILIETVDVSQTLDGIFVPRANFNFDTEDNIKNG